MSPPCGRVALVAGLLAALVDGPAAASAAQSEERVERRAARAMRTDTPPRIDGVLDDAVWARAEPIGELIQVEPIEGAAPSEASEIRFLYDQDHLYIGLRLFDSDPGAIISTSRERDAFLDADDLVMIVLDTFQDGRNAFWFQVNAAGSKGDGLITNGGQDFNKPWDGIWESRARIDELGWTVEMAVPFKTLSFAPGLETWGLNVSRTIGRRQEHLRWSGADLDLGFFNMAVAGTLSGLRGIRQGIGLDVVPFFVADWTNDRVAGDKDLTGDPGLDAFYKITPNLTLALTVNTDFAETEVDQRQINLTRFPLFFPERRDFFLQDAGQFEFADLGTDLIPFFSRTIGLSDTGKVVPVLAGAKLTGRTDGISLGVLDVQIDEFEEQPSENLFVARVSRNVGEQSTIGGIVTWGDPNESADNALYGVDANFRTSSFLDDKNLHASVWGLQTHTEDLSANDIAYGASVFYPNDLWSWWLTYKEIQANFNPALGFVPRTDIRKYTSGLVYEPRIGGSIRQLEFSADGAVFTDTDDRLETADVEIQPFGIEWETGDAMRVEAVFVHDELDEDFEISEGVTVPIGEYDWARAGIEAESSSRRDLSCYAALTLGDFFDGERLDYLAGLIWHPGPLFSGSLEYLQNDVDLPGGEFQTQILGVRSYFSFTPSLSWNTFVQWDNVSQTVGVNSRLRWIPEPGQEIFLVFNETLDEAGSGVVPLFQQVAFKITYTFRF